jgi:urea transporter
MLIIAMLIVGACVGILIGSARAPHFRVVPFTSAIVLSVSVAAGLLLIDSSNGWAAVVFVLTSVAISVFYAAHIWDRDLQETSPGYATLLTESLMRPRAVELRYGDPVSSVSS